MSMVHREARRWALLAAAAFTLLALAVPVATADDGVTVLTLTSFDGVTLAGTTAKGKTFAGSFTAATSFQQAALQRYIPVDPCRSFAATYNAGAPGSEGFASAISSMASNSCHARVSVSAGVIRLFQPVP